MTGTLNSDILLRDHIDGYRRLGWNGWCENLKPIVTNFKKLSPKNRASRGLKSIVALMNGYRPLGSHWLLRAETWLRPPAACARAGSHGSLEGVGGLKTNEAYHSKADALLIQEM